MLIVYTIIAVDKIHPSYESHYPTNNYVDGKKMNTCLSCYWDNSMEWFMEGGADHTLDELFEHTHEKVAKESDQNVSVLSDIEEMGKMTLRDFMGNLPARRFRSMNNDNSVKITKSDVPAHLAMWKAIRADKKNLASAVQYTEAKRKVEVMKLGCSLIYEKAAYMTLCFVCIEDTFLVNCVVFDMYYVYVCYQ